MGYHRAGFEVVGVDINPQPHYPFEFHQADAMTYPLDGFDVIHASPPCQDHSGAVIGMGRPSHGTGWMLPATVERFEESGVPWIVENVEGPDVRMSGWWFTLCGTMFGLGVRRHRRFGSNQMFMPPPCQHKGHRALSVFGNPSGENSKANGALSRAKWKTLAQGQEAMGMNWGNVKGVAQAIPPAYTEFIGRQLLQHLSGEVGE